MLHLYFGRFVLGPQIPTKEGSPMLWLKMVMFGMVGAWLGMVLARWWRRRGGGA